MPVSCIVGRAVNRLRTKANDKWCLRVLLAILLSAFYALYANRCYPVTEGWHITYAQLLLNGKVPYNDFYYYMPPLDIFINALLWSLSFGKTFLFRIWMMLIRIAMMETVFSILLTRVRSEHAFLATLAGGVLISGNVYDLLGDYNQIVELLCVMIAYFLNIYCTKGGSEKQYLFVSGVLLGLGFCEKQSFMFSAGIVLFCFLFIYCKFIRGVPFLKEFAIALLGTGIPIALTTIYLIINNAFGNMLDQVFLSVNSKGRLLDIVFTPLKNMYLQYNLLMIALLAVFSLFLMKKNTESKGLSNKRIWHVQILVIFFIFLGVFLTDRETFKSFLMAIVQSGYICIAGAMLALLLMCVKADHGICIALTISAAFLVTEIFILYEVGDMPQALMSSAAFDNLKYIYTICFYGITFYLVYCMYKVFVLKEEIDITWFILCVCSFISCYAGCMAAGNTLMGSRPMVLTAPVCIAYVLNHPYNRSLVKTGAVFLSFLLAITIIFSQKVVCAYAWWGTSEADIHEETQPIELEALQGFRVSPEQAKVFEESYHVIQANQRPGDRILGFPGVTIFNLLTNNLDFAGKVPVYFYDVCPDKYVIDDVSVFSDNPPEFIVWQDIPDCMEVNEYNYRNGRESGQRKLVYWLQDNMDSYIKIGQVNNVFVYMLNDGRDVKYRYVEDEGRINVTLSKNYRVNN